MKYKCLIIDHDDTAVNSTPTVNYPAFVSALKKLRPQESYTLEEFMDEVIKHGFYPFMTDVLKFNEEEIEYQENVWREYADNIMPQFFPGLCDVLRSFKAQGGIICVLSQSSKEYILQDYIANMGIRPDEIFGCELKKELQKPSPYAVTEIQKIYGLKKEDILLVDDLPTGLKTARAAGTDFAYAGWGMYNSELIDYMAKNADYVFTEVYELADVILG